MLDHPQDDAQAIGDPYKTLFLSRLVRFFQAKPSARRMEMLILQSKKVTEADLRHEFEMYGAIERIRMVKDLKGKSKSYAFIVYERERDMKSEWRSG
jgi:U1 small nuclear ribonucleoprotein